MLSSHYQPLTNVLYRSIIMLHMGTVWDRQGWCTTLKLPRNEVSYTKVHLLPSTHVSYYFFFSNLMYIVILLISHGWLLYIQFIIATRLIVV